MARRYSDSFRLKAVRRVKKSKLPLRQVATALNFPESTLRRWVAAEGLAIAGVNGITDGYLQMALAGRASDQEKICWITLEGLNEYISSLPTHVQRRAQEEAGIAMSVAVDSVVDCFGPDSIAGLMIE